MTPVRKFYDIIIEGSGGNDLNKMMEDVLKKHIEIGVNKCGVYITSTSSVHLDQALFNCLSEWGEICTSKMAEEMVKQQKEHNRIKAEKESIISELITALEASNNLIEEHIKNGYGVERVESNYQLIQKYKAQ